MQDALRDILGPMFEAMLQGEMDSYLGYESNNHGFKNTTNRRNGYTHKKLRTSMGEVEIDAPRDRDGSFDPQLIPKRSKDVSGIEDKVLSMYAKGMSQRDIADTIEDIYGFDISHETISNITDQVIETANEWQNHPLKKFYTFLFVDCLYVNIRKDMETKSCAVYVVLGYDVNGIKDILGIWIGEAEGKHYWMQIFDEIKKNVARFNSLGNISSDIAHAGPYAVPRSALQDYANSYDSICSFDGNKFEITDYERFGQDVLSGVPMNNVNGAYMIEMDVPMNSENISMPSVSNASAYAPYFVSGGKLLSGETETTIRPLAMPVDSSKPFPVGGISGSDKGIGYRINLLRGKR